MLNLNTYYLFDGAMGTMLQEAGLPAGTPPEKMNLTDPEAVGKIHAAYAAAGAGVLTANTFGASRRKLGENPAPYIAAGIAAARRTAGKECLVALDVGPLGALLEPFGDMAFEEAYSQFTEIVEAGEKAGADLVLIETMSDLLEAKAALLAAKERTNLPVFVTMTFGEDGRTFLGVDPAAAAVTLTSLGADVIGINCSLGPGELRPVLQKVLRSTHLPVMIQPNAGLPRLVDGESVYDVTPEEFARWGRVFLEDGAAILGGCCGTTPAHIRALRTMLDGWGTTVKPRPRDSLNRLCGWQRTVTLQDGSIATVGERLNPTGRQKMKDALYAKDWETAAEAAVWQEQEGADFLVVNTGLPDIDDTEALPALVLAIQKVSALPLVIDCSNPVALEKALRICRGRPVLNSVNGGKESLEAMLPLAVKYGTGLIVLALDGDGIRSCGSDRCATALKTARAAETAGVRKEDIWIDCLALAASASQNDALAAPEAVRLVRQAGYKTVLGVSNVSYGLPGRDELNCAFLASCLAAGLNVAIINTASSRMMDTLAAMKVLTNVDKGCAEYISRFQITGGSYHRQVMDVKPSLETLIMTGQRSGVPAAAEALLKTETPLEVINGHIIPALDAVGERYENGSLFLPQLMASAETVKTAFEAVRAHMPHGAGEKGTILLATVKNDVHDIGKNIVKMLLENYGYRVIDLGRDVPPEDIVKAALETRAALVGLSSLMTTTAQNIAVTIQALRASGAPCRIMVGGAVVTQAFADQIGADFYVKDAAQSARVAALVFGR